MIVECVCYAVKKIHVCMHNTFMHMRSGSDIYVVGGLTVS